MYGTPVEIICVKIKHVMQMHDEKKNEMRVRRTVA